MSVLLHFCGQYHGGNAHGNDGHVVLTTQPCGRHAGGGDGGDDGDHDDAGAINNNMNTTNTTSTSAARSNSANEKPARDDVVVDTVK